jgi:hypothetical protein
VPPQGNRLPTVALEIPQALCSSATSLVKGVSWRLR